ncbi:hypothetical protein SGGMMB4_05257 [Sodalis glossinidius str. 'morsitans']|uniref:Uncharacterized protein n=1 Tax=Sodalis glossinidius (strain morsitans) TaxID=343509 RepID=A0A193QFM5_SODGM|nr:hypothetical protein [Sodalis glossinidius]CRL43725.1 hypothetical protein SGGMMB4_00247 [Sodalis glossinidius str. 'morsitans']CRL46530.1 hypothetical protein SGGMMB4_05257 [Sodalis glossinidius str. 'morsitans']
MLRIKKNMAACAFGGYDFDACTPRAVRKLTDHLPRYAAFSYQTASHTPQSPRIRLVVAFSRLVHPDASGSV